MCKIAASSPNGRSAAAFLSPMPASSSRTMASEGARRYRNRLGCFCHRLTRRRTGQLSIRQAVPLVLPALHLRLMPPILRCQPDSGAGTTIAATDRLSPNRQNRRWPRHAADTLRCVFSACHYCQPIRSTSIIFLTSIAAANNYRLDGRVSRRELRRHVIRLLARTLVACLFLRYAVDAARGKHIDAALALILRSASFSVAAILTTRRFQKDEPAHLFTRRRVLILAIVGRGGDEV